MKYERSFGAATFKQRLIQLMDERSLSQKSVSELAGVTQGTVSRWLSGSVPDLNNVKILAEKTEVPLGWLAYAEGHLPIKVEGIEGFLQRAKTRVLPRLDKLHEELYAIATAGFLSLEDREMVQALSDRLAQRRGKLMRCVEELESLPPDESAIAEDIIARSGRTREISKREKICWLLDLLPHATDERIMAACRAAIEKKQPRDFPVSVYRKKK